LVSRSNWLGARFYYASALCRSTELDELQQILAKAAPTWASRVRTERWAGNAAIDLSKPGSLREIGCAAATRRGPTYQELIREYGRGPFERQMGGVGCRGHTRSLWLGLTVDDYLLAPRGNEQMWGNQVSLQVNTLRVEGANAVTWLERVFDEICLLTRPVYANGSVTEEWDAQNIDRRRGVEAIGIDLSRHLPGLYWLNFLGFPYLPLVPALLRDGEEVAGIKDLAGGLKIRLSDDPAGWTSDTYQRVASQTRELLGKHLMFERDNPHAPTIAPNFAALFGAGEIRADGSTAILAHPVA
jgi:hypothetical protein